MTPERHAKIQEIFDAVLDLPADEQQAYLAKACDGDAELLLYVQRLIDATADDDDRTVNVAVVKECPQCGRCFEGPLAACPHDSTDLERVFPGSLLIDGKYQIEKSLGRGGMGSVYLVKHVVLQKRFALKLILADGVIPQWYIRRFETEARALGRLKHPNVVDVTDYGVDPRSGGLPYLVMEYLEGRTVSDLLKERTALPPDEAIPILGAVAHAIDCAHAQKIVHGDLKPSNLFLAGRGDAGWIPKVVDFGLARLSSTVEEAPPTESLADAANRSTVSRQVRGTPGYMAPELFLGEPASKGSDLFAFGVLAYEICTGKTPFGRNLQIMGEKLRRPPVAPSAMGRGLPVEMDAPILALIDPKADRRPSSALAAVDAMEAAILAAKQRQWRDREAPRRAVFAAIAAALVLLITVADASWGLAHAIEGRVADARFAMVPKRTPDPRLLVVSVDDEALANNRRPLVEWASEFGVLVERMFTAGARAVAIDNLLPVSWSETQSFRRMLERRADHVVLGLLSANSGVIVGNEPVNALTAFVLGPDRYLGLFGYVNIEKDNDAIVRRARVSYIDGEGRSRPSFAGRAVTVASLGPRQSATDTPFWIDYSVRPGDVAKISWKDVEAKLTTGAFQDRLVIIGADYAGSGDEFGVPSFVSPALLPGVMVQAMIANTLIAGMPVRGSGLAVCMAPVGLACFAMIAAALRFPYRFPLVILLAAVLACGYALFIILIFVSSRRMVFAVGPEFAIILSAIASWQMKIRLSQYPSAVVRKKGE